MNLASAVVAAAQPAPAVSCLLAHQFPCPTRSPCSSSAYTEAPRSYYIAVSNGTLRMVGFSSAKTHQCAGTTMLSRDLDGDEKPPKCCSELVALESCFGVDSDRLRTEVRQANRIFPEFNAGFFFRY